MNAPLITAALRACVTLSNAIEATLEVKFDGVDLGQEIISEVQSDLVEAYNLLTKQLSEDLNRDARRFVRDLIAVDLESSRAILTAQTGLRFPIEARE
jgi:hypothetical protein